MGSRSMTRFLLEPDAEELQVQLAARWPVLPQRKQTSLPKKGLALALGPLRAYGGALVGFFDFLPLPFGLPAPDAARGICVLSQLGRSL